ncbi:MAG TPA: ammonia-forming cytochrome c nitrite reductase subunit c552, partial [Longimicrobiales bacterium]|nr:ammonia-forming cytochrome c nitrite reductase subunit c552 [Longimicrobiales bacterium]
MSRPKIFGVAILALWAAVLAVHVQREYFKSETVLLAEGAETLAPGTYFYAVEMGGQSIGMATSRLDTLPEGFRFEETMRLEIPAAGATQTLDDIANTCLNCHQGTEKEFKATIDRKLERKNELAREATDILAKAHLEAARAWELGATEEDMKAALQDIRHGQ